VATTELPGKRVRKSPGAGEQRKDRERVH
jgi:hypothetical protein